MLRYILAMLWFDYRRYLPAVLAVGFSALLVALQLGLLLGTFSSVSIPIDRSEGDIWIGSSRVVSVDLSGSIPESWQARVAGTPIERVDSYVQGFAFWRKPDGALELVIVIGAGLHEAALGRVKELTPELRRLLAEPGSVVVDRDDCRQLGINGVGDCVEVTGQRVRVVGLVQRLQGLAGPYLFCSRQTARSLLRIPEGQTTYLVARCHRADQADRVAARLRARYSPRMAVFTKAEFSNRSRRHWLVKTGGGIALLCAAALGLFVGAVITSQTLYAATMASVREWAILRAMGTPPWRLRWAILLQSSCVGLVGVALALPLSLTAASLVRAAGARVLLPLSLLALSAGVTLVMAVCSGGLALRSLRQAEPTTLLR